MCRGCHGRPGTAEANEVDGHLYHHAYEGDDTRQLVRELDCIPVVPTKKNRREAWEYDRQLYKQRNEVEQLFRRLKRFRRIFTLFDHLMSCSPFSSTLYLLSMRSLVTP